MRRFAHNLRKTFNLMSNSVNEPLNLVANLSKFKEMIQPLPRQILPEIEPENTLPFLIYTGFLIHKHDLYNRYFKFFSMFFIALNINSILNNYRTIREFILDNSYGDISHNTNYLDINEQIRRQINGRLQILDISLMLEWLNELNFSKIAFFVEVQQTIYFTVNGHKGYTTITYLINIMNSNFESFMRTTHNIKYYSGRANDYIDEFNISCILMIKKEDLDHNESLENYLKTEYTRTLEDSQITPRIFHENISDIINLQIQCEIYAMSNGIQYRPLKLVILDRNNHPRNTYITRLEESTINKIREYIRRQPSRIGIRGGEFQTKKNKKLRKYK